MVEAARLLAAAWRERRQIEGLPQDCRPVSVDDGYAVQDALVQEMGHAVIGYKIGATNTAAQRLFGIDRPFAGCLLEPFVLKGPAQIAAGVVCNYAIEAEFAFLMERDLPPRERGYEVAEVMAATETLIPAIEVPDSRLTRWETAGIGQLIADDAVAGLLVLGAPAADWRTVDLSQHAVTVRVNGQVAVEGSGGNVLGDPRCVLTWLANHLSARRIGLKAAEIVTTGTVADIITVRPGDQIVADFGAFGQVEIDFGA